MKSRKLNKREFARAIRHGLGSALLHVKDYGDAGVENILLDACLTDYVYDAQSNCPRAEWLAQLIDLSGRRERYAEAIRSALLKAKVIDSTFAQLVALAVELFDRGFFEFKAVIFNLIPLVEEKGFACFALYEGLVKVAGLFGLELAILLMNNLSAENWEKRCLYEYACELWDESEINAFLEEKSTESPLISEFWLGAQNKFEESKSNKEVRKALTFDELMEKMEHSSNSKELRREFRLFAKRASEEDLQKLLKMTEEEIEPSRLINYLTAFEWTPLPMMSKKFLLLLDSENDDLRRCARNVLRRVRSDAVRKAALKALKSENEAVRLSGVEILELNYKPNDFYSLENALRKFKDIDYIHWASMALLDIAKESDDRQLSVLLIWAFETQPCAFCRRGLLNTLITWNSAPTQLLYEAQWDVESDVSILARTAFSIAAE